MISPGVGAGDGERPSARLPAPPEHSIGPRPPQQLGELWREALAPFLLCRAVLALVGVVVTYYLLPLARENAALAAVKGYNRFPDVLWLMWQRFDSGFYLNIASDGYWPAASLQHPSNWVFWPLYPLLVRTGGLVAGGSTSAFDISGVLVALAASLVAVVYLFLLVRHEVGSEVASRSVMLLAAYPLSFFLTAIYAESTLLAASIAAVHYARQRRWWLAGLCGGLAALARGPGVFLLFPLLWELWQAVADEFAPWSATPSRESRLVSRVVGPVRAARHPGTWGRVLALCLVPAGLGAFLLYARVKTGDFLAPYHNYHEHWGRYFVYPWSSLLDALRHPQGADPNNWNFWSLNLVSVVVFAALLMWIWRRLPGIYGVYSTVMVLVPLASSRLNGVARYYLVVFPAFIVLAMWAGKTRPRRFPALLAIGFSLQSVFFAMYVAGAPAIA